MTVIADQPCLDITVAEDHAGDMIIENTACMTMLHDRRWNRALFIGRSRGRSFGVDAVPADRGPCGTPSLDPVGDATGPRGTSGWRALAAMTLAPLPASTR